MKYTVKIYIYLYAKRILHTFPFAKLCYHDRMRVWWCQWYDRISTVPRMIITSLIWYHVNVISSVVDPKLFFSDPDPIFCWDLDPDPDPTWLVKSFGSSFGSDPKYSLSHNSNDFKWLFIDFKASFSKKFLVSLKFSFGSGSDLYHSGSRSGSVLRFTDSDPACRQAYISCESGSGTLVIILWSTYLSEYYNISFFSYI
jgi:hypothetical protein